MSSATKISNTTLATIEEAAEHERAIGALLAELQLLEEKRADLDAKILEKEAEAARLGEAIYAFVSKHRSALLPEGEQTLHLPQAGSVGWRRSVRIIFSYTEERVIRWLKRHRMKRLVRAGKESVNKELLHEDPALAQRIPGIAREELELFTIKPKDRNDRLERDPLEQRWARKTPSKKKAPAVAQAA